MFLGILINNYYEVECIMKTNMVNLGTTELGSGMSVIHKNLLIAEYLENKLMSISKYEREYNSPKEQLWIRENLENLGGIFDSYGNYHVWIKNNDSFSSICYCININSKTSNKYLVKEEGYYLVGYPNVWQPEQDAGIAIMTYMIENNIPGYYLFFRKGGEKWLSENMEQLFVDKDIYFCFNFCDIGNFEGKNKQYIFIDPEQSIYFPKHRLNFSIRNCIGTKEQSILVRNKVDSMRYLRSMAMQLAINPGIVTRRIENENNNKCINTYEFTKIAIMLLNQKFFADY
jgi:hypothetical protein